MTERRCDWPGRYGGICGPNAIRIGRGVLNDAVGMAGNRQRIFIDLRGAVMIVAVTVGNVGTRAVLEFDLETVADIAGVVDGVEVVDGSVSDAGVSAISGDCEQPGNAAGFYPAPEPACVWIVVCFHLF